MKKFITVIIGIVGLIAVLAIALAIFIATLDPNDYKDTIAAQVQKQTGRQVSLNGDIRLSYYPWLGLELNDVTLANPEAFGKEPFLHVDHALVRVKTIPMLQNRYEIDTVELYGAVINLAKTKSGTSNWQDLGGGKQKESKPLQLSSLILGGVDIRDARISWHDNSTGARYDIHDLDLSTGQLVYGQPVDLKMSLDATSNQPAISGDASMTGTIAYDMDNKSATIKPLQLTANLKGDKIPGGSEKLAFASEVGLDLNAGTASVKNMLLNVLGMRVAGDIEAKKIHSPAPSVTTSVDINGSDLALLFKVAEIEPLATQLAGLRDRSFNLKSVVDADLERGDVSVPQLTAQLLGASIKGQVKAQNVRSKTPSFQGELNATGPDLPTLMQVAGQFQGGEEPVLEKYGKQLAAIPAGQKAFSVDTFVDADLNSGDVNVPRLSVKTLGVNVDGNLKASGMQNKNGNVEGKLSVSGQNLSKVLAALDQKSLAEVLQDFNLKTSISGNRADLALKPITLTASFAGENIPNSPVKLDVNADTRVSLEKEELHLDDFSVKGLGLNVDGKLDARNIMQDPRFQGSVNVAAFNLRRLMRELQMEIPKTADNKTLRKVAFQSSFSGSKKDMAVKDLVFVLDDTTMKGNLAVKDFAKPVSEFNLNVDKLDADRYLPPKAKGGKQQQQAAAEATELPVDTLRSLNTSGKLHIGHFVISNIRMNNVNLTLSGKDGLVKLDPITAALYRGTHKGDITINAVDEKKSPRLTINTALKDIQIEPLMVDVTGKRKIRGTGDFSAALFAVGDNTDMIKQTLNGQMSFSFRDGALIGFNLGKIMRMGDQLKENMSLKVSEQEETDFTEITGNPVVTNGIVKLDDLNAKSPALRISGEGVLANLAENTLNYTVTARIVATSKGQGGKDITAGKLEGVPLPCHFRGSLDNPKRNCDATRLITALGLKAIKGITEIPGKVTEKVIPGDSPLGNLLNKLPGTSTSTSQDSGTQTDQQTNQQTDTQTQQDTTTEKDQVEQARDLLKGIFGK